MPILYFDSMGSVDFQPALNVSAIYADESKLVTGGATGLTVLEKVKERVVKADSGRGGRSNLKFSASSRSLPYLSQFSLNYS